MTDAPDLSEFGREALRAAKAQREQREAMQRLTKALEKATDKLEEFIDELERARMEDTGDDDWRAEA